MLEDHISQSITMTMLLSLFTGFAWRISAACMSELMLTRPGRLLLSIRAATLTCAPRRGGRGCVCVSSSGRSCCQRWNASWSGARAKRTARSVWGPLASGNQCPFHPPLLQAAVSSFAAARQAGRRMRRELAAAAAHGGRRACCPSRLLRRSTSDGPAPCPPAVCTWAAASR